LRIRLTSGEEFVCHGPVFDIEQLVLVVTTSQGVAVQWVLATFNPVAYSRLLGRLGFARWRTVFSNEDSSLRSHPTSPR